MVYLKTFHIVFVITWFAGLFYLPRLFVYHAMSQDSLSQERFCVMERKLLWGIMTPSAILVLLLGFALHGIYGIGHQALWFYLKLVFVLLLYGYHLGCIYFYKLFLNQKNSYSHIFFRWFNEVPVVLLIAIVWLVVAKPF